MACTINAYFPMCASSDDTRKLPWLCICSYERVTCVCVHRCFIRPRVARGVGRAAVQCCRGIYPPLLLGAACWAVLLYTAHCCWAGEEEEPLQPGVSGRAPPPHTQTHHNNAPAHTDHWGTVAIPTRGRGHCCNAHQCWAPHCNNGASVAGCSSRQYIYTLHSPF